MNIVVVMAVAGHDRYFYFASKSIPSFLRNCPSTDLLVFTDNVPRLRPYLALSKRLHLLDYMEHFRSTPLGTIPKRTTFDQPCTKYFDSSYNHKHVVVAALLPMAQHFVKTNLPDVDYILKIDCDAYFAGGDVMQLVKEEIERSPDYDLYLVQRTHHLMGLDGMKRPGAGFTLWAVRGRFIPEYVNRYKGHEQKTILALRPLLRTKILTRPGFHFVLPFREGQPCREYKKEDLEPFLPAYFHVHLKEQFEMLEKWFGAEEG